MLHKNLNAYPRILRVPNHASIHITPTKDLEYAFYLLSSRTLPLTYLLLPARPAL